MDSFIENFYVALVTELIMQGIQGAGTIADKCINKAKLQSDYKKKIDEFLKSYPNESDVPHKKLKKNAEELAKYMGQQSLYLHDEDNVSVFCSQCREMLEADETEIPDTFILDLFDNLQMLILQELPSDVMKSFDFINRKAFYQRSIKKQKEISDNTYQIADSTKHMADNMSQIMDIVKGITEKGVKIYGNLPLAIASGEVVVVPQFRFMEEPVVALGSPIYTMQIPNMGNNVFDNFLERLRKKAEIRRYRQLIGRDKLIGDIKSWLNRKNEGYITYCSLIGPGGAGKTHIGMEVAKEKICGFQPYYFEKDNFSELKKILEEHSNEVIFKENTLLVLDYVYEQIEVIQQLLEILKKTEFAFKVAIMFIERDSTMEYIRKILPSSLKFFVNVNPDTDTEGENVYWLSDEDLRSIMFQMLSEVVKEKESTDKLELVLATCVNQLNTHIDPVYRRPIFMIFLAEMYENACQNNRTFEIDMQSMDMLLEKYWVWKTDCRFRDICKDQWGEDEIARIKLSCEEFSKVLLVCASILGRNILLVRKSDGIPAYEIGIERAMEGQRKYLIPLLEKYMNKIPESFIQSDEFTEYMEKLCKTQFFTPMGLGSPTIIIRPEKDILAEWLIYREIICNEPFGMKNSWLRELVPVLREYAMQGYIALVYRGTIDFPIIVQTLKWIEEDADFEKLTKYCGCLLSQLAQKEIYGQIIEQVEIETIADILSYLGAAEDYFNADYDIRQMIERQIMLEINIDEQKLASLICHDLLTRLPEKLDNSAYMRK